MARGASASRRRAAFGCVDDVQVASDAGRWSRCASARAYQVVAGQCDAEFSVPAAASSPSSRRASRHRGPRLPAGDAAFLLDARGPPHRRG
ncbi:MAG: hypothetical protein IPI43_27285 [Sandaracinaceae bacterium]|nr:hypothetical protein [Sandaracinaceae bacterium]